MKNKRKSKKFEFWFVQAAAIALCICACSLLLGCFLAGGGGGGGDDPDDPCKDGHTYSDEWSYDEYFHWHETTCGHIGKDYYADYETHKYDDSYDEECNVCGYKRVSNALTFTLSADGKSYSVKGSTNYDQAVELNIPSEYKRLPVTEISSFAFSGFDKLEKITIPDTVTRILGYAFEGCSSLENIEIPNGVTEMISGTFQGCTSLKSVKLPDTLEYIDTNVFYGCYSLTSITVPASVTRMSYTAFTNCYRLAEVYNLSSLALSSISVGDIYQYNIAKYARIFHVSADEPTRVIEENNCVYFAGDDRNVLLMYTGVDEAVLPQSLGGKPYDIGNHAFYQSTVTSVTMPSTVVNIGESAFETCTALKTLSVSESITEIGNRAFYGDYSLESITLPDKLETIGESAFGACTKLTEITVPNSVTKLGESVFASCSALDTLSLPFVGLERNKDGSYNYDTVFGIIFGYRIVNTYGSTTGVVQYSKTNSTQLTKTDYYVYAIPSSLKSVKITDECIVPSNAFLRCAMLESIEFAQEAEVRANALGSCGGLTEVTLRLDDHIGAMFGTSTYTNSVELTVASKKYYIPATLRTVTAIGDSIAARALYCCNMLTDINISDGVTSVGTEAFYGCTSITEIDFPDSVTSIAASALSGCTGLVKAKLPAGLTDIYSGMFKGCAKLTSVTLPTNSLLSIGGSAFYGCALLSFDIPSTVTSIGESAFYGCASLDGIVIPQNVTRIESGAFENCSSLSDITIPNGVSYVGGSAFAGCSRLTSLTVPESVEEIGNGIVARCSALTDLTLPFIGNSVTSSYPLGAVFGTVASDGMQAVAQQIGGTLTYYIPQTLRRVTVTGGEIKRGAFMNCGMLTQITVPNGITYFGQDAFSGCTALVLLNIPESLTELQAGALYNCSSLTQLSLPSGIAEIGAYALFGCTSLPTNEYGNGLYLGNDNDKYIVFVGVKDKSVNALQFHASMRFVSEQAIESTALTEIVIPSTVSRIGEKVFYNCTALENIVIPQSVTSIAAGAVYGCRALGRITVPFVGDNATYPFGYIFGSTEYAGSQAVMQYRNTGGLSIQYYLPAALRTVTVTGGEVYDYSFYGCSMIGSVTLPSEIDYIGKRAFEGCTALVSIVLPDTVTSLRDYAFYGCASLKTVRLSAKLEEIGVYAFKNCTSLSAVELPATVTSVDYGAYSGCTSLLTVKLSSGMETVATELFLGCTSLVSVDLGSIVTIGESAFSGCLALSSVVLPQSLTTVYPRAFYNCEQLGSVTYNEGLLYIGEYAFYNCKSLLSATLPESLKTIGDYAYRGCAGILSATINVNVESVGEGAFYGSTKLRDLRFIYSDVAATVGENAFYDCSSLISITIPNRVTKIGAGALRGCTSLSSVVLPFVGSCADASEYESVFGYVFGYARCESAVSQPSGTILQYRDSSWLYYYYIPTNLTTVTISGGDIYDNAFNGCYNIVTVELGSGVTFIGLNAFKSCGALTSVDFGVTNGWYVTADADATSGTAVVVSNGQENATKLTGSYTGLYWKRNSL